MSIGLVSSIGGRLDADIRKYTDVGEYVGQGRGKHGHFGERSGTRWIRRGFLNEPLMAASDDDLIRLVDPRPGHFALESGDHGDLWLDLNRPFLTPHAVAPFASRLAERLSAIAFDVVCGPFAGGAFLARMIAFELAVPFCMTERLIQGRSQIASNSARRLIRYRLPEDMRDVVAAKRITVIDDAINAGHAVGGTIAALRASGAEPVVVGALLVLEAAGRSRAVLNGLPLMTLVTLPSARWRADACPLCAEGVMLGHPER